MVSTTYEADLTYNTPGNMFKALGGIIYTAPIATPIPAAFTTATTADLVQLDPLVWTRLGLITKGDGVTFSRDVSTDEEQSWGYNEATRIDITSNVTSAKFTLQETTKEVLSLYDFVDLSAVTADATTGEFQYSKPITTTLQFRRMIFMAVDGAGTQRRYRFKIMPRAQVVAVDDEVWQQGAVTKYPLTIRANTDTTLGYAVRNALAGPGQKLLNAGAKFV